MSGGRVAWLSPGDAPDAFPAVENAMREPDGLLAAGGDLGTPRLLAAYRQGIFPWYDEGQPLLWWSPDPRCVFRRGDLHIARRLRKEIRNSSLEVRVNTSFSNVIAACAGPRPHQPGTWITPDMQAAYERLSGEGWAHSVEVWEDGSLVGGLYGLAIGRAFFGESMFSRKSNASKMALLFLDRLLDDGRIGILDCQVHSSHLVNLGATSMPRSQFVALLRKLCEPAVRFSEWPKTPTRVASLLSDAPV
jgi:leucyl/phenylalanyl-tRNA--protein transferase